MLFIKNTDIIISGSYNIDTVIISSSEASDHSNIKWDIAIYCGIPFKQSDGISCRICIFSDDISPVLNTHADEIISCGMSSKSTITLSSIDENRCVLALQRELVSLGGKIIAPKELPIVPYENMLNEAMLISAALMSMDISSRLIKI